MGNLWFPKVDWINAVDWKKSLTPSLYVSLSLSLGLLQKWVEVGVEVQEMRRKRMSVGVIVNDEYSIDWI